MCLSACFQLMSHIFFDYAVMFLKLLSVFSVCRDFMDPTMDSTKHILNYLMPILEQVDAELHDFMIRYTHTI